jgi:CRISPR-associated protein Csm1
MSDINREELYLGALLEGISTTIKIPNDKLYNDSRQIAGEDTNMKPTLRGLYSVLQTIGTSKGDYKKALNKSFKINPLNLDEAVFPSSTNEQDINGLLNDFNRDYSYLNKTVKEEAKNYTFYHLLYKYGTRVGFPLAKDANQLHELKTDISLFDRNRIIAGIIKCKEFENPDEKKPFLLVKGDLSGIQKFIYYDISEDITESGGGKKIAKKLRGRSFFIALFTEFIAEHFIEQLKLEQANLIFAGGGHFNLVLPNTKEIKDKINALEKEMNLFIRNEIGSSISLILASVECEKELFTNTSNYFLQVNERLEQVKQQKHKEYLSDVFYPKDIDGNERRIKRKVSLKTDIELGQQLPYANYLIELHFKVNTKPLDKGELKPTLSFEVFDKYIFIKGNNRLADDKYFMDLFDEYENEIKFAKVIRINNVDFTSNKFIEEKLSTYKFPIAFGFKLIGKEAPTNEEGTELLDFSEIAELDYSKKDRYDLSKEEKKLSYPQLAAMRLDVDDLGAIFATGLNPNINFQRVASLSREFHLFFSGYFNELAKEYQVYIVYSGGDDAFVVGSWLNIVHFAQKLHKKFKEFVCKNNVIDFSAGIFLCHPTYPVARFAEDAAKLEKLAKGYKDKNGVVVKNAIHIFDHTLSWKNFESMMEFGDLVLNNTNQEGAADKEKLARSMIHRLLRIIKSTIKNNNIDFKKLNKNRMLLHYLFARHGYTSEYIAKATDDITKGIIKKILEDFTNNADVRDYLIATSYVILKTRKTK